MVDPASTEEFLKWVEKSEAWYDRESDKWSLVLSLCRICALCASLVAVAAAAASDAELLKGYLKYILVGATLLSAFSTEILSKLGVRELEDLREEGHIEATRLARYTRQKFAEFAGDAEKLYAVQDEVRVLLYELDKLSCTRFRRHRVRCFIEQEVCHGETAVYARVQA